MCFYRWGGQINFALSLTINYYITSYPLFINNIPSTPAYGVLSHSSYDMPGQVPLPYVTYSEIARLTHSLGLAFLVMWLTRQTSFRSLSNVDNAVSAWMSDPPTRYICWQNSASEHLRDRSPENAQVVVFTVPGNEKGCRSGAVRVPCQSTMVLV